MVLNKEIAQEIVERTMAIIGKNINVMNEEGIIIGSGQKDRIGKIHDGALLVVQENRKVEITSREAAKLKGSKAGVNLPIVHEKQIVGVVGITGDPKEVYQYGELVKMAAEVTLQQAFLTEQLQWDERLREEVVLQIIHDETDSLFYDRADRLGINLETPRIAVVIKTDTGSADEKGMLELKRKITSSLHNLIEEQDLITSTSANTFVLLKAVKQTSGKLNFAYFREELKILEQHLSRIQAGLDVKAAAGIPFENIHDAKKSYEYARKTLKTASRIEQEEKLFFYNDFIVRVLIMELSEAEPELLKAYDLLLKKDKKGELAETLEVFIEENGELNETARRLFIHRNTLRYRLNRIEEVTGKDPKKIKDLLELYIARLSYLLHT
ncbi:sugar diacid recognition domain-containing protein [Bacillus marinisedimentorum]|uniref:sugar diacid recognition domain-containing protein n=1 Tax=Bacillus marinisedimentorum TaxID=1821260 RepID=UPI000871BECD|nr:sugar diacid recognition domain-containing protein [Bacillus marinisedimentorum]